MRPSGRLYRLSLIIALVVVLCGLGGVASAASFSNTPHDERPILFPAQVPPEVGECSVAIGRGVDGAVGPLFCGSRINVLAWRAYVELSSTVTAHKYPLFLRHRNSSLLTVKRALCSPSPGGNQILAGEYGLASAYFGWHFKFNEMEWVDAGNCVPPADRGAA